MTVVQVRISEATSMPEACDQAAHRSPVSVLPYAWRAMYACRPAWNCWGPRKAETMLTTALPLQ